MTLHYQVYGLRIRSEIAVDGLTPLPPLTADLEIRSGEVRDLPEAVDASWLDEEGEPGARVTRGGGAVVLEYRDGTRFRIERGLITTSWTTTAEDMATYLLGPVLAFALRMRGTLVLHASAVAIDGEAVVFAGAAGAGKSTTAAALLERGATMLTDDVAAIVWKHGVPHVEPGTSRIRLWNDSAAALRGSADALPLLTPNWEKRFLSAPVAASPLPLRRLLVLAGRGETNALRTLKGHEAVMAVLARTAVPHLIDDTQRETELTQIAELVAAVPVAEWTVRNDLSSLGELADALR